MKKLGITKPYMRNCLNFGGHEMQWFIGGIVFIYGLVFGSFYNVVIYRLPLDINIAKGRSFCPHCRTSLRAKDLIPLFSWILLRGKCRYCSSPISFRYPFIEFLTGLLFLSAFLHFGMSWEFFLYASFYSMLLITAMIDLDHMIICDEVIYIFSAISTLFLIGSRVSRINTEIAGIEEGFAPLILSLARSMKDNLYGLLIGAALYALIYFAAKAFYKREAFGSGDIMLMGAIGWILGGKFSILTAVLSFYVGLAFILLMKLAGQKLKLEQEIPFGPYICISAFLVSLYGDSLISAVLHFMYLR